MCFLVVLKPLLAFIDHWIHLNESESTEGTKWTNSLKVSDSLDNEPNENVVTTNWGPTNLQSDQLLELLEWLFATKNVTEKWLDWWRNFESCYILTSSAITLYLSED